MAIAHVQSITDAALAGTTQAVKAFASNVVAGNLILVVASIELDTTASCADSQGNSYTPIQAGTLHSSTAFKIFSFWAIAGSSAANTVTVTFGAAGTYLTIGLSEYSGTATTNPIDQTASGQGNGTSIASGNLTTANANDLLWAGIVNYNAGSTLTAGTNFTIRHQSGGGESMCVEDRIVSSTGTYSGTATQSQSVYWLIHFAAIKAAGGTTYTQSLSASMAPFSAGIARRASKVIDAAQNLWNELHLG